LRTRPQRNLVEKNTNEQNGEDLECESVGDFLGDNDGIDSFYLKLFSFYSVHAL